MWGSWCRYGGRLTGEEPQTEASGNFTDPGNEVWGEMDTGLGVESNDYLLIPGGQKFFSLIKESLAEVLKMISVEGLR